MKERDCYMVGPRQQFQTASTAQSNVHLYLFLVQGIVLPLNGLIKQLNSLGITPKVVPPQHM